MLYPLSKVGLKCPTKKPHTYDNNYGRWSPLCTKLAVTAQHQYSPSNSIKESLKITLLMH